MTAFHIGFLAMCLVLQAAQGTTRIEIPKDISIPDQISAFYKDYNFISSYSTTAERNRLVVCLNDPEIPKDLDCQRLKHVLTRMQNVRLMILANDSEMVLWKERMGSFFCFHFRPVLFVVSDVRLSNEKALVEVRSYALEPDMILRFIAEYDNHASGDDKNSSFEKLVAMTNLRMPGLEIHRWCRHNGKWMKRASDQHFLDENY